MKIFIVVGVICIIYVYDNNIIFDWWFLNLLVYSFVYDIIEVEGGIEK